MLGFILLILAAIFFAIGAFGELLGLVATKFNPTAMGLLLLTLAILFGGASIGR